MLDSQWGDEADPRAIQSLTKWKKNKHGNTENTGTKLQQTRNQDEHLQGNNNPFHTYNLYW